jgi:hypothetical protein
MKKKWYKIKVWKKGDYDLVQECDRELTDVQVKNFRVDKKHRGTIEEIQKKTDGRKKSSTKKT